MYEKLYIDTFGAKLARICNSVRTSGHQAAYTYYSAAFQQNIATHLIYKSGNKVLMECLQTDQIHEVIFERNKNGCA